MTQAVRVLLFARFRDLLGTDAIEVTLPDHATVKEVREQISRHGPSVELLLSRSQFAVNGELAGDDTVLRREDEIALLPPVSGG